MQDRLKQLGLTPAKGALVGGLMLLLAIIWGPQMMSLGGGTTVPYTKATANRSAGNAALRGPRKTGRSTAKKNSSSSSIAAVTRPSAKRVVPAITASEAGGYDPFMVPSWSPAAAMIARGSIDDKNASSFLTEEEIEKRASSLRQAGVAMVLVSSTGRIAKIGDRTVKVGDEIDGFRVMEITTEGIVLHPSMKQHAGEGDRDDSL